MSLVWRNIWRRTLIAACGLLNVGALLAWVFDLGAFHVWFLLTGVPASVLLAVVAVRLARRPDRDPYLRRALVAGAVGGLLGTLGYDVFRIPFVVGGLRLFAPIDSYGVLLLDAAGSSATSGFAGWSYHFANGIGFGIAYAAVALGRKWPFAVLWGLVLETATILTPFADSYAIAGEWDLIAIAYAAHLAYGIPLGIIVQRAVGWQELRRPLPVPAWALLTATAIGLAAWLQPTGEVMRSAEITITDGRFSPEWVRVAPGTCARIEARDAARYNLDGRQCNDKVGAHRVRVNDDPYSGGFLLVDDDA